ncbi:uncharacterized protein M6B38_167180 [Iris pallida]|uniref:Myb-like domain-containing protein n=1 Tax=Iris pallida TaxID=29817 RepID=A0AAX6EWM1_IRIPA|nr:uncharacterized protein M6B38_167180 [Iris pallida]
MEFVEEESRPRFLFQSRPSPSSSSAPKPETLKSNKLHLLSCFLSSSLLLFLSFYSFSQWQTLNFLLVWTSLSLLLAPFAPSSATAGDPRVGLGDPLPPPDPASPDPDAVPARRSRSRKPDTPSPVLAPVGHRSQDPVRNGTPTTTTKEDAEAVEESEWTDEDFDVLKKQISKHPAGEPRRWEKIAEAFRGRHRVESVIRVAKSLSERRPDAKDSFAQFLKQRKPVDKRIEEIDEAGSNDQIPAGERERGGWSSGEDIALLNALKAFPKEVSMRWEKVAAAVPGRSKAECVKRVGELKRGFRSSKA